MIRAATEIEKRDPPHQQVIAQSGQRTGREWRGALRREWSGGRTRRYPARGAGRARRRHALGV